MLANSGTHSQSKIHLKILKIKYYNSMRYLIFPEQVTGIILV